ncbi:MAG: CoA transferase [Dehalococcoidia bacterium]
MFRVLDLTSGPAGGFAAMFLGALGSRVLRLVDEEYGDNSEVGLDAEEYFSTYKTVRPVSFRDPAAEEVILAEARASHILIEDWPRTRGPRTPISIRALRRHNRTLVVTSITPFGLRGPRSKWKATELVSQAMGGILAASGSLESQPTRLAGYQASHVAGLHAAIVTLSAAIHVHESQAPGVQIDLSLQEVMSTHWTREIGRYVYTGEDTGRSSERLGLQGFPHTVGTEDGFLFLLALGADWPSLASFLGLDAYAVEPWDDADYRVRHWDELEPEFRAALKTRGRYEWFEKAAERGWTMAPVDGPMEVLQSPHLAAREFFHPVIRKDGQRHLAPGLPFTQTGTSDKG